MSFSIDLIKKDIPFHQHKKYEISVYIKGTGIIHTEENDIAMSPGKIIIIPPNIIHSSTRSANSERIYINGDFNQIFGITSPTVVMDNPKKEGTFLAKMIYNNRYANPEYVASLLVAFSHFLIQSLKMDDEISVKLQEIVDKITGNFYDTNINLNSILKESGYAEDYIRAKFKKFTGKTPTEFLTGIRISHACYLIDVYKHSLSLTEIAEKCGYTDYIYFSRRFKKIMGMSPQKYMNSIL